MDTAPPTPWSTGKLHRSSIFLGQCLRSRDCITPTYWLASWSGSPLWTPDLHLRRSRAFTLPSKTGWLASQPSTVGITWQKYVRGSDIHDQRNRKAIPSDKTDDILLHCKMEWPWYQDQSVLPLFFRVCLGLPQHSWYSTSDEIQVLSPRLRSFIFQVLQGNLPTILPLILLKGKHLILRTKMTVMR